MQREELKKNSNQLRRCPFCGGKNIINTYTNFVPSLLCGGCGARMIVPMDAWGKDYEKMLLDKWNTRKPLERIVERLEEKAKEYTNDDLSYRIPWFGINEAIDIVREEGELDD